MPVEHSVVIDLHCPMDIGNSLAEDLYGLCLTPARTSLRAARRADAVLIAVA
jgi:hypothetical protein